MIDVLDATQLKEEDYDKYGFALVGLENDGKITTLRFKALHSGDNLKYDVVRTNKLFKKRISLFNVEPSSDVEIKFTQKHNDYEEIFNEKNFSSRKPDIVEILNKNIFMLNYNDKISVFKNIPTSLFEDSAVGKDLIQSANIGTNFEMNSVLNIVKQKICAVRKYIKIVRERNTVRENLLKSYDKISTKTKEKN